MPERFHFRPGYALAVVGFGTEGEHAETVARIRVPSRRCSNGPGCEPFWEALLSHAMGSRSYINSETDCDEDRAKVSYGEIKYERLARIKATYDPDNVFHLNANIKPALQPI